jgi:murein L,D-transpeptidase YafK
VFTLWIAETPTASSTGQFTFSYPDALDRARAKKLGVPAGGDIYVHGLPNGYSSLGKGHRLKDWTDGCIAVTNEEMDEIWSAVPDGTPIEITP